MIFNKGYDMSLWLILASNTVNRRRKILDFVNEYPDNLIHRLHVSLDKYADYVHENFVIMDMELTDFNDSIIFDDVSYWYCIDVFNGTLELGRTSYMGDGQSDVFQLSLSMFSRRDYESHRYFQEMYLGTVTGSFVNNEANGNKGVIDFYSTQFSIIKAPFDRLVVKSNDFSDDKNRYCSFDFSTINEDYNKDSLNSNDVFKGLVRSKKNKSFK